MRLWGLCDEELSHIVLLVYSPPGSKARHTAHPRAPPAPPHLVLLLCPISSILPTLCAAMQLTFGVRAHRCSCRPRPARVRNLEVCTSGCSGSDGARALEHPHILAHLAHLPGELGELRPNIRPSEAFIGPPRTNRACTVGCSAMEVDGTIVAAATQLERRSPRHLAPIPPHSRSRSTLACLVQPHQRAPSRRGCEFPVHSQRGPIQAAPQALSHNRRDGNFGKLATNFDSS